MLECKKNWQNTTRETWAVYLIFAGVIFQEMHFLDILHDMRCCCVKHKVAINLTILHFAYCYRYPIMIFIVSQNKSLPSSSFTRAAFLNLMPIWFCKPHVTIIFAGSKKSVNGKPEVITVKPPVFNNLDLDLDNHCPPVEARHLNWNWTRGGDVAIQPCPSGSTGLARWTCDLDSLTFVGRQPDMSDCKSIELSDLETKVREEDPENVVVSSLAMITEERLFGGDLEAAVNVLKAVLNRLQYLLQTKADSFYNKESFLHEIFQNVLRSVSNLLKEEAMPAWRDLPRSRRIKVASSLSHVLEEHAFLLINVIEQPETIIESTMQAGEQNENPIFMITSEKLLNTTIFFLPCENWFSSPYGT